MRLTPAAFAAAAALALAALLLPGPGLHAQVRLPALGEAESEDLSVGAERRLGDQIMRDIRRDPDVVDDPLISEYVDSIFYPLVGAARQRGDITPELDGTFAWETFLVRDRSFNAFALPGGFIGVHLGLIGASGSSDEMASVLGHELSHITQRHIARSMANSKRQSMATMAAMLIGLIASSRSGNGDIPMAVIASGQAAMATGQLSFSREMEREADRFGLDVMSAAGFAPSGMAAMFERLEAVSRLNDSNQYPYLRSHPLTIARLSEARLRAREMAPTPTPRSRPAEHALMRARSRVLMDPAEQSLRRLQAQGAAAGPLSDTERLTALYGGALAAMRLRDFEQARTRLDALDAFAAELRGRAAGGPEGAAPWDIGSVFVRRDLALARLQLAVARRVPSEIEAATGVLAADTSRPTMLALADAAIARQGAGDPAAAALLQRLTERLQTWVSERRGDALAWSTLSQCAEPIGLKLRAIRADAEAHAIQGDLQGAIDRLHAGQRFARAGSTDFVEASIIDSRLREIEAERRSLEAELKRGG